MAQLGAGSLADRPSNRLSAGQGTMRQGTDALDSAPSAHVGSQSRKTQGLDHSEALDVGDYTTTADVDSKIERLTSFSLKKEVGM